MAKARESTKLIELFRRISFWSKGYYDAASVWRAERCLVAHSVEDKQLVWKAQELMREAQAILAGVFGSRIGKAVASEIESGSYTARRRAKKRVRR